MLSLFWFITLQASPLTDTTNESVKEEFSCVDFSPPDFNCVEKQQILVYNDSERPPLLLCFAYNYYVKQEQIQKSKFTIPDYFWSYGLRNLCSCRFYNLLINSDSLSCRKIHKKYKIAYGLRSVKKNLNLA